MNLIKKVFDKQIDNSVHLQFQKFGKGEFLDRALVNVKHTGNKYTITTTAEFANEMVRALAEKLGDEKSHIKGAIITTLDLDIDFKDKKQFQGVKKYIIEKEMSGNEILDLINKFPKAFFALTFDSKDSKLKIKPKSPKSGKPGSKGKEKPKPNFCRLVTTDAKLGQDFVFEKPDFNKAEISHDFIITEIIKPEGEKDYAKARELAKIKGKILRKAIIDDKEMNSEIDFIV